MKCVLYKQTHSASIKSSVARCVTALMLWTLTLLKTDGFVALIVLSCEEKQGDIINT